MGTTIRFLRMESLEEGKWRWPFLEAALLILAFILRGNPNYGLALLVGGIYIGAFLISGFNRRNGIEALLSGSGFYRKRRGSMMAAACLRHNLPLEVGILGYLFLVSGKVGLICILYCAVLCLWANAVGMLLGSTVANGLAGMGICICLIAVTFMRILIQEEYLRFISPVVQIGNLKSFQWWNLGTLLLLAFSVYMAFLFRKKYFYLIGILGMAIIIFFDISTAFSKNEVPEPYKSWAMETLEAINEENRITGLPVYEEIVVYKSVYYPWSKASDNRVFYTAEGTLYMNCFTEYLCNLDKEELVTRCLMSTMKPHTKLQNAMAELYAEYLLGNIEYVKSFAYRTQTEEYGEIVSPNYGLAAETLLYRKEDYGKLYELTKQCESDQEVLDAWMGDGVHQ